MTITCNSPTTHFDSGCKLLLHYDKNNNGKIDNDELMNDALPDYSNGIITRDEANFVGDAGKAGSINALCPGCYTEDENAITCNHAVHYPTGCELLLHYDADDDGVVTTDDAWQAVQDGMTSEEIAFITDAASAGSINALCPGCYSEDNIAIFRVIEFTAPDSCEAPCNINIYIKWKNVGTTSGSFIPKYEINGVPYTDPQQTLEPNATYTIDDVVSITSAGTYEICPYPNE